jgi:hypothetical protein
MGWENDLHGRLDWEKILLLVDMMLFVKKYYLIIIF